MFVKSNANFLKVISYLYSIFSTLPILKLGLSYKSNNSIRKYLINRVFLHIYNVTRDK